MEANEKSHHQEAKCTFFQLDRRRHQFLREGEYRPVRASTTHLGTVAKLLVVDSGAGETVMPVDWLTNHLLTGSDGSRANDFYTTADGSKVYNEGQRKLDVCTLDGQQRRSMTFQVARVKKAVESVSRMVKNGNKLVFDQDSSAKDTSYIQNKRTNEKIWLRQKKGVYVLDVMVAPPQLSNDRSTDPLFYVSSSCLALVALCCADKRLFSAVALLFPFFLTHCAVMFCVFALSVVGSCVTDFTTSHAWLKSKVIRTASPTFPKFFNDQERKRPTTIRYGRSLNRRPCGLDSGCYILLGINVESRFPRVSSDLC